MRGIFDFNWFSMFNKMAKLSLYGVISNFCIFLIQLLKIREGDEHIETNLKTVWYLLKKNK